MKRTKEWWARLTKAERRRLWLIERGKYCWFDKPYSQCQICAGLRNRIIAKANGEETP